MKILLYFFLNLSHFIIPSATLYCQQFLQAARTQTITCNLQITRILNSDLFDYIFSIDDFYKKKSPYYYLRKITDLTTLKEASSFLFPKNFPFVNLQNFTQILESSFRNLTTCKNFYSE